VLAAVIQMKAVSPGEETVSVPRCRDVLGSAREVTVTEDLEQLTIAQAKKQRDAVYVEDDISDEEEDELEKENDSEEEEERPRAREVTLLRTVTFKSEDDVRRISSNQARRRR
jgi:hypothetical protein